MNLKKLFDAVNAAQALVNQIAAQIVALYDEGKVAEAVALQAQLDEAKKAYQDQNQLYLSMLSATSNNGDPAQRFVPVGGDAEPAQVRDLRASPAYRDQFFAALRAGATPQSIQDGHHSAERYRLLLDALTETGGIPPGAEGGLLLPTDFDTTIREFRRLAVDLSPYVTVEPVTTLSGWRAMEVGAAALPFAEIFETPVPPQTERLAEMENPTFTRVTYTVRDFGGYLPIANNLLSDTPAAIMRYLGRWIGRKTSLTNTSLILARLNALVPVVVAQKAKAFEAIKTALNVTLDPAISVSASIFVNQSGFDILDNIVDGVGKPLLQDDPTNPSRKQYKGRPIVVVPSAQWANVGGPPATHTRIAVGDARELVMLFDRQPGELATTLVGGGAWRNNNAEIRYIMRADAQPVDTGSVVLLHVPL
jgi:HK97 family phage major capsid protein